MKSAIKKSATQRLTVAVQGRCCVCGADGCHQFADADLDGPVCNECLAPLLIAEAATRPVRQATFYVKRNRK